MHDFEFEWLGIIGLADPLREEVPNAMAECQRAGIRVIMITGDYPKTAQAIATQAGMLPGEVITGEEVDHLTDDELQNRLRVANICARISPQQKLRIVEALKRQGEIVTMTGDGVNDAPALKSAHVGIAMGSRGTDVAREAADLVLSDDNFASIVRGISTGRRIFKNLQKSMSYIFAIHIPIAMLALFPMLFALPPIFLPLHIALLEMIIDPACSLAFENEPSSESCMTTPPRDTTATLFGKIEMAYAFIQGILVLVSTSVAYWISENFIYSINTIDQTRSMVMVAFVIANGLLIFISKSEKKYIWQIARPVNWVAITIATSTIGLVLFAIYFPLLSNTLKFSPLGIDSLAIAMACGSIGLIVNSIFDLLSLGSSYKKP
jgi:Ca2+-transporting ATPase